MCFLEPDSALTMEELSSQPGYGACQALVCTKYTCMCCTLVKNLDGEEEIGWGAYVDRGQRSCSLMHRHTHSSDHFLFYAATKFSVPLRNPGSGTLETLLSCCESSSTDVPTSGWDFSVP